MFQFAKFYQDQLSIEVAREGNASSRRSFQGPPLFRRLLTFFHDGRFPFTIGPTTTRSRHVDNRRRVFRCTASILRQVINRQKHGRRRMNEYVMVEVQDRSRGLNVRFYRPNGRFLLLRYRGMKQLRAT